MATYQCVDGPLAGELVSWRRLAPRDRAVTVAEVDVGHSVLAVDYRVQDDGPAPAAGRLRFVGARDVRPGRRGRWRPAGR